MSLNRAGFIAVALFLSVLSDRTYAGLLTYDFVDRTADQGIYHVTGSITVQDSAIAAGTLLHTDVVSYMLSVTHGATTDFTLTDSNSLLSISGVVSISATHIFLPVPPPSAGDEFSILANPGGAVSWQIDDTSPPIFQEYLGQILPSPSLLWFTTFNSPPETLITPFDIATNPLSPTPPAVPEPSSLVIAMTLFGGLGLMGLRRRTRRGISLQCISAASRYSLTSSMRPQRLAQPSGVDLSSESRSVDDAPACGSGSESGSLPGQLLLGG